LLLALKHCITIFCPPFLLAFYALGGADVALSYVPSQTGLARKVLLQPWAMASLREMMRSAVRHLEQPHAGPISVHEFNASALKRASHGSKIVDPEHSATLLEVPNAAFAHVRPASQFRLRPVE
jgi:hypothetical protein